MTANTTLGSSPRDLPPDTKPPTPTPKTHTFHPGAKYQKNAAKTHENAGNYQSKYHILNHLS
jgi:hypothetical protein